MAKPLIGFLILMATATVAAGQGSDTSKVDTLKSVIIAPCDTCGVSDTSAADTLTEAQKALERFEQRRQAFRDSALTPKPFLSYFDTVSAYYTSPRLNYYSRIQRSFYKGAGDYFRTNPAYFISDYQVTPMRETVQPFGLSGDRLNVLIGRYPFRPFEHVIEPDGLMDLNDVPTALDHDVYILPGAAGAIFGGGQIVATLITLPLTPDTFSPESALLVDKGSFGYSFARARYSKKFVGGRKMDLSLGYRRDDGPFPRQRDDVYHYTADVFWPLSRTLGIRADGVLYDRSGYLAVQPETGGNSVRRERIDRNAHVTLVHNNEARTVAYELGYAHLRQASRLFLYYNGNFNYTGNGGHLARTWLAGGKIFKAQITGNYLAYDNGYAKFERGSSDLNFSLASLRQGWRYALAAGGQYIESFGLLPNLAAVVFRDDDRFFAMFSLGYTERAPTLHELHLPFQGTTVYGSTTAPYADEGNPDLVSERQLIGNADIELGAEDNSWGLSITGGRIQDGIDWHPRLVMRADSAYLLFNPENGAINFCDATFTKKARLANFLHFTGGGAYHFIDYVTFADKAYSPDYQLFSGLELHVFWAQKLLHLYAYGEMQYVGPFHGYVGEQLGEQAIFNAKLSFEMRSFRFHWVIQNVLSTQYESRDFFLQPGRYNYFGFSWNFLD